MKRENVEDGAALADALRKRLASEFTHLAVTNPCTWFSHWFTLNRFVLMLVLVNIADYVQEHSVYRRFSCRYTLPAEATVRGSVCMLKNREIWERNISVTFYYPFLFFFNLFVD